MRKNRARYKLSKYGGKVQMINIPHFQVTIYKNITFFTGILIYNF